MTVGNDEINYDELVQSALRGVVRQILDDVACQGGLPGGHHFYIAFRTRDEHVVIPPHMRERYPDEMTIVLQHRYWNLEVFEDRFEVDLSFNQKREHLVIPFAAITGFVDPSVQFALQFQEQTAAGERIETGAFESRPLLPADELSVGVTGDDETASEEGGKVVALDSFRKKRSN